MDDTEARELAAIVAEAWGVTAATVTEIESGHCNRHWRVETSVGAFVLRSYSTLRLPESIPAEHAVLEAAANAGWPVALPIHASDGARVVPSGGTAYSLFPLLEGTPIPDNRPPQLRIQARLLARMHRDLHGSLESQRPGFGRAWELDVTLQTAGADSFNSALTAFARDHAELAAAVRRQRYRNLRELARLGYGELPSTVIHGDFTAANLLFSGATLTGVLDFDEVRRDAAIVDVAECVMQDCTTPSARYALDPRAAAAFVEEYCRARPLSEAELAMLPALIRAAMLRWIAFRLAQWTAGVSDRPVPSIERSVNERFPALDEVTPSLLQAVVGASG